MIGNGFLSPSGVFHECEFGEHSILAEELTVKYGHSADLSDKFWRDKERVLKQNGFIYFGHTGDRGANTDSYVFLDFADCEITKEQIEWVRLNNSMLTEKQIRDFDCYASKDLGRIEGVLF